MIDEELITDELPPDLTEYDETVGLELECTIRRLYGVSFHEYATTRNRLLAEHNGSLEFAIFHNYLVSGIIIDLVGRGYLGVTLTNDNIKYTMTKKAIDTVKECVVYLWNLPKDPYQALVVLRNMQFLEE
jgi:hypothetical protein